MKSIFKIMRVLEEKNLYFDIRRYGPESIDIIVTIPGARIEISFYEDDTFDFCVFSGSEMLINNEDDLMSVLLGGE